MLRLRACRSGDASRATEPTSSCDPSRPPPSLSRRRLSEVDRKIDLTGSTVAHDSLRKLATRSLSRGQTSHQLSAVWQVTLLGVAFAVKGSGTSQLASQQGDKVLVYNS